MGRNIQLPAVHVYSQRGAREVRGARGAVFRDIASHRRYPMRDTSPYLYLQPVTIYRHCTRRLEACQYLSAPQEGAQRLSRKLQTNFTHISKTYAPRSWNT